jgi:hypothetical protein
LNHSIHRSARCKTATMFAHAVERVVLSRTHAEDRPRIT